MDHVPEAPKPEHPKVSVVSFDMPFGDMAWFLVKLAFAAIPAAIFLGIAWMIVTAALSRAYS